MDYIDLEDPDYHRLEKELKQLYQDIAKNRPVKTIPTVTKRYHPIVMAAYYPNWMITIPYMLKAGMQLPNANQLSNANNFEEILCRSQPDYRPASSIPKRDQLYRFDLFTNILYYLRSSYENQATIDFVEEFYAWIRQETLELADIIPPNAKLPHDRTLGRAVRIADPKIVALLLDRGANPLLPNQYTQMPFEEVLVDRPKVSRVFFNSQKKALLRLVKRSFESAPTYEQRPYTTKQLDKLSRKFAPEARELLDWSVDDSGCIFKFNSFMFLHKVGQVWSLNKDRSAHRQYGFGQAFLSEHHDKATELIWDHYLERIVSTAFELANAKVNSTANPSWTEKAIKQTEAKIDALGKDHNVISLNKLRKMPK